MEKTNQTDNELIYKIALSIIPGIGPKKARNLLSYVGNIKDIFYQKKSSLSKIPGISYNLASNINQNIFEKAENEINFIQKNNIKAIFYLDKEYPKKLSYYDDSPILIYVKGDINFNKNKFLSIVGTRSMTHYGEENCKKLIEDLKNLNINPIIVSGLAYGIDYCAHSSALINSLKTIAILGHGLDIIYPAAHKSIAEKISNNGALISEFTHNSRVDSTNFVRRNRIIAAISDATIIVESAKKGGSLITAEYGVQYSKDVFAFPGRTSDKYSEGCNFLIKTNRAAMIENANDLIFALNWKKNNSPVQKNIFIKFSDEEQKIVDILKNKDMLNVDTIAYETRLPINKVLAILFNLEFKNAVKALPGRMYKLTI
jgi:DNA processing protein